LKNAKLCIWDTITKYTVLHERRRGYSDIGDNRRGKGFGSDNFFQLEAQCPVPSLTLSRPTVISKKPLIKSSIKD